MLTSLGISNICFVQATTFAEIIFLTFTCFGTSLKTEDLCNIFRTSDQHRKLKTCVLSTDFGRLSNPLKSTD